MAHFYSDDREFKQAAIDTVSRLVFDAAAKTLSNGSPIHSEVKALLVLSNAAHYHNLSNTTINTYYTLLDEENSKNDDLDGWEKEQ